MDRERRLQGNWKRWRAGFIGALVSVVVLYVLFARLDNVEQMGAAFVQADYTYVLLSLPFFVLALAARAVRWRVLLSEGLPLVRSFSILNISYLVNGILPLRVGELARAYLATRADPPVPPIKSISTIITERLLDLLAVVLLLAVALTAGPLPEELRVAGLVLGPLALAGFLVLVFLSNRQVMTAQMLNWLVKRVGLLQRFDLSKWLTQFMDGLDPLRRPRALALAFMWTGISWAFSVGAGYVLMLTFYERADFVTTCLFIAASSLAVAVPAVPGNVGPYEASILLVLGATGYAEPYDTALAFALVVHGLTLAVYAVVGMVGFVQEGVSLAQLSEGVQSMRQQQAKSG